MERCPLISIITVCLNAEETIEQTILSVIEQTYANIEYIIKDGGSTDHTLDIINKYKNRINLVKSKDKGIYDAMNQGKSQAKGDFLLFLGADDVLYDKIAIESVAAMLTKQDSIYYGNVQFTSDGRFYAGKFNKWKWGYMNICHQAIFYPKSIYTCYDYEEKYKLVADWAYNLNLLNKHVDFEYMDLVVAHYNNVSGISSNRNDGLFLKERMKLTVNAVGYIPFVYGLCMKVLRNIKGRG